MTDLEKITVLTKEERISKLLAETVSRLTEAGILSCIDKPDSGKTQETALDVITQIFNVQDCNIRRSEDIANRVSDILGRLT